ncbi:MAG: sugar ABC transporter ATP-binding protein [bacterium]|nr:sugar ABC transporter ATP-binding protein [bacterium]
MNSVRLQLKNIRKEYPGTVALDDLSLTFRPGEVHALIGKNGAGKSTAVKILSGAVMPTSGKITLNNNEIILNSPSEAISMGISTVYQEMSLIPDLTIAENILFGRLPGKNKLGLTIIDWDSVFTDAEKILKSMKIDLNVRMKVSQLDVAKQQIIEIAKAMSYKPRVLMLDEPTSALAHHEVQELFRLIKELRSKGVIIIYISHRLQELQEIADVVSVLRDGKLTGSLQIDEAVTERISELMFGEEVTRSAPLSYERSDDPVLEVNNLSIKSRLFDVSFKVYKGEVLGIAGLLGSGRSELLRAVFGADPIDSGEIIITGTGVSDPTPEKVKKLGLGMTPENRKEEGLIQVLSVSDNLSLACLDRISNNGIINRKDNRELISKNIDELHIAVSDTGQPVNTLSGGNQQKVVIGNWLNTEPGIMFFDEPTRGIDVQAKQQIFRIIKDLSRKGISSVFVSTELEELLEVCNRVIVLQKGRIVSELSTEGLKLETLFESCMEA